jgi:glycosyltransferase involved in cell wall biosynthesis
MARATVIIPTFGKARFARWAIKSVQNQTVKDIEICIICDGSPEPMVSFFRDMMRDDPRISVFVFPKSPRTGEPYRDLVLGQTTGKIICYCSHDDLWLPDHVQVMENSLKNSDFVHTLHTNVNPIISGDDTSDWLAGIYWKNLNHEIIDKMKSGENFFGLTFGAHTRDFYYRLPERWVTTPKKETPTDLSMWCKFLSYPGARYKTIVRITALCFPQIPRKDWSEHQRDKELKDYFGRVQTPGFFGKLKKEALKFCPSTRQKWEFLINSL